MKFWKIGGAVAFVGFCVGMLACTKSTGDSDNCQSIAYAPINMVTVPDTMAINVDVPFRLRYTLANSCGRYIRTDFGAGQGSDTLVLAVVAEYTGCDCLETSRQLDTTVNLFRSSAPKKWYLKCFQGNNNFLLDSIVFK